MAGDMELFGLLTCNCFRFHGVWHGSVHDPISHCRHPHGSPTLVFPCVALGLQRSESRRRTFRPHAAAAASGGENGIGPHRQLLRINASMPREARSSVSVGDRRERSEAARRPTARLDVDGAQTAR